MTIESSGREDNVRQHMTFGCYSDGYRLVIQILNMWDEHDRLSYRLPDRNARIDVSIDRIRTEHELTIKEWHYWCQIAATRRAAASR